MHFHEIWYEHDVITYRPTITVIFLYNSSKVSGRNSEINVVIYFIIHFNATKTKY
jgi:hypothetical protein